MSRRSGFTIVEILVVVGVTIMLSTVVLVYSSGTRKTLLLLNEKAFLGQLVIRSKSLALSTYTDSADVPCGYGVRIDRGARAYALVAYRPADCNERGQVDTQASSFEVAEQSLFRLPQALSFAGGGQNEISYVIFIPPDPAVLIADENGNLIGSGRVTISAQSTNAIVAINAAGQVTF